MPRHYENFPIASRLLPRALREPVAAIYAFARSADDIADEGEATADERLSQLQRYRAELTALADGKPSTDPLFARLSRAIHTFDLPLQPFQHLLDAFAQDVVKTRYATYAELEAYCRHSAQPVGRLLLRLFGVADEVSLHQSDAICTALQLINFCQDVASDRRRGRVYLPQDEMARFHVAEAQIAAGRVDAHWQALLGFQCARAAGLLQQGAPLILALPGRCALELAAIIAGAKRILVKLAAVDYDVFTRRPLLIWRDWPGILWCAMMRIRGQWPVVGNTCLWLRKIGCANQAQ